MSDLDFQNAVMVYRESWQESHKDICSPEYLDKRDYFGYLDGKRKDLFLVYDPEPVGVFCLKGNVLSDLYIHPQRWGEGYGTACIQYALRQSPDLRLTVLSTNTSAISLYQKMGFHFTGRDIPLRNDLVEREMQAVHTV